jgi:hypothetical protein
MVCAACGKKAPDMVHEFHSDVPPRKWVIIAPLYHEVDKVGPDGKAIRGFCNAYCVAAFKTPQRAAAE